MAIPRALRIGISLVLAFLVMSFVTWLVDCMIPYPWAPRVDDAIASLLIVGCLYFLGTYDDPKSHKN